MSTNQDEFPESVSSVGSFVLGSLQNHFERLKLLVTAAEMLINALPPNKDQKNRESMALEILRAGAVLLDAILEDSLREVLRAKLLYDPRKHSYQEFPS